MTADTILYWIAFGIVMVGVGLTFTRHWRRGLPVLAIGSAVCAISALLRGYFPEDALVAALAATYGLGVIYIAHREGKKRGIRTELESEVDGGPSEEAGA